MWPFVAERAESALRVTNAEKTDAVTKKVALTKKPLGVPFLMTQEKTEEKIQVATPKRMNMTPAWIEHATKALLKVGYKCNNACSFCHSAPHARIEATQEELTAKIQACVAADVDLIAFSGGEPTIREDLPQLAEAVERASKKMGLVTNGRMLAYEGLRRKLLSMSLAYIQVSLAGAVPTTHDSMVRVPGAFDQTIEGLKGILLEGCGSPLLITINSVLTKDLTDELSQMAQLLLELSAHIKTKDSRAHCKLRFKLSALEPEGNALKYLQSQGHRISHQAEACRYFFRDWGPELESAGIEVGFEGFPLCLMNPYVSRVMDLWSDSFLFMSEAFEDGLHPIDDNHRKRYSICHLCSMDDCPGLYRTYESRHGHSELKPIIEKRSNSIVFQKQASFKQFGGFCPPRQIEKPKKHDAHDDRIAPKPHPFDSLYTFQKEEWHLWQTKTHDFSHRTLHHTKNQLEQIYMLTQDSKNLYGESLFHAVIKMQVADFCRTCPQKDTCGKIFVALEKDVIAREERLIGSLISRLEGTWLDLGCGVAPYSKYGNPSLHLIGIDPDQGSLQAKDAAGTIGDTQKHEVGTLRHKSLSARAEALPFSEGAFDGALSVRSLPHFHNPVAAASEFFRVIRPGGDFHLLTDVIFGILALHPQCDNKRFQHYRNPTADQAADLLRFAGFEIEEEKTRGPRPSTSNLAWVSAHKP